MHQTNQAEEWTKADHEQYVIQRLCEHLGDATIQRQRERPDFVIANGSGEIGVELTRYRTPGPENEAEEPDLNLKDFIRDHWLDDDTVNRWNATLYYRMAQLDSGRRIYTLPRRQEHKVAFVDDLKRLVQASTPPEQFLRIYFVKETRVALLERIGDDVYIAEEAYPTLSRFCNEVVLFHSQHRRDGRMSSNFNAGAVGIDAETLQHRVEEKLNRLSRYRENLPGAPIWLLIYNEGNTIARRVESLDYQRTIIETVTSVQERHRESFDAIWWGTNMLLEGSGEPEFIEIC